MNAGFLVSLLALRSLGYALDTTVDTTVDTTTYMGGADCSYLSFDKLHDIAARKHRRSIFLTIGEY